MKTGLAIAIPSGTYARVAPRSGLAVKQFIDTGAGVIDEDYRGEVGVVLFNHSDVEFQGAFVWLRLKIFTWCTAQRKFASTFAYAVKKGDRVAQLILERILTPEVREVSELDETERGANGYGSTGVAS